MTDEYFKECIYTVALTLQISIVALAQKLGLHDRSFYDSNIPELSYVRRVIIYHQMMKMIRER